MRKLFYIFIATSVLGLSFASCSDDDDDVRTYVNTPEIDAKGVFEGTYSRVQSGLTDTVTAMGQLTIIPTDSAYVADVLLICDELSLSATVASNIAHANDGYIFSNNLLTNATNNPFAGRISDDQNIEVHFTIKQRSGRKTVTYNYTFEGVRTSNTVELPPAEEESDI